jgi:hypothetical protein
MKKLLIGSTTAAILSLTGLAAHAGCMDPRTSVPLTAPFVVKQAPLPPHGGYFAAQNIVGTWDVVYTTAPSTTPTAEAFIQWHSDGTEWENINFDVLGGNICMGSWRALDASHVSRNHYGWLFNGGAIAGFFNETETDEVAWDGNSYTGTNSTTLHLYAVPPATLPTIIVMTGTTQAMRIAP